ncbi:MAG TPA: hypothetical protein VFN40_12365 [Gemmatimonadales bacterium]|nr:hypothetical protein [Gemmatimonadales bacterium]
MPGTIEFVEDGRGLVFSGSGVLTGQEILEAKEALAADEVPLRTVKFALVLLEDVTAVDVTIGDLRAAAIVDRRLAQMMPNAAVAIVAPRDHDFGIARMWEAIADVPEWTTYVFRSREEADAWLRALAVQSEPAP